VAHCSWIDSFVGLAVGLVPFAASRLRLQMKRRKILVQWCRVVVAFPANFCRSVSDLAKTACPGLFDLWKIGRVGVAPVLSVENRNPWSSATGSPNPTPFGA
jgi:hypothetical protein